MNDTNLFIVSPLTSINLAVNTALKDAVSKCRKL